MLQYEFEESMGYWICSTSHAFRRALNAELEKEGITFRQWEVLAWLAVEGGLSQVELAERLGIEAPTLVGILDRMERDGWLDRTSCPNDRRKKRIRATEKVETVWAKMVDCARRVRAVARAGLSEEELNSLKTMCERIRANLAHSNGESSPGEDSNEGASLGEMSTAELSIPAPCQAVAISSVGAH